MKFVYFEIISCLRINLTITALHSFPLYVPLVNTFLNKIETKQKLQKKNIFYITFTVVITFHFLFLVNLIQIYFINIKSDCDLA